MESKTRRLDWVVFLMLMMSSLVVFQYSGMTFFLLMQILFCVLMVFTKKIVVISKIPIVNFIFIELVLTAISAVVGDMRYSYKQSAVIMTIFMIPMYFTATYLYNELKKDKNYLKLLVKAIKVMILLQLCWIPLQAVAYYGMGIDLNKLIFVETLHLLENATFIRSWVYYPSGFSWHSAVLAPLFVIAFVMFDNIFIRALVLLDAMICGNSTAIIGVAVCVCMMAFFYVKENGLHKKIKAKTFLAVIALIVIGGVVLFRFNMWTKVMDSALYLLNRMFGAERDASTAAHFGYYSDYPQILKDSSVFQILFGYGYGCSGYPITMMYDRYTTITNWAIESDILDILISRGMVGFVGYYGFLFYIAFKGLKVDYRYFVVMVSIMLEGFGYNVQWEYVFFIELLMYFSLKLNINFFEPVKLIERKKKRSVRFVTRTKKRKCEKEA